MTSFHPLSRLYSEWNNKSECVKTRISVLSSFSLLPSWAYIIITVKGKRGTGFRHLFFAIVHCWQMSPSPLAPQKSTVWMVIVKVPQQSILGRHGMAAFFTNIKLAATLLVRILLCDTMNLFHVGLQRAALGKGLLTQITLIWTNTCRRKIRVYLF